jgi:hypothetical protein
MSSLANPARGEAALTLGDRVLRIRPTFAALVAAEEEVGPLLALVDRAAKGLLGLKEIEALLWHCLAEQPERAELGEALLTQGIGAALPALRTILRQILSGGQ